MFHVEQTKTAILPQLIEVHIMSIYQTKGFANRTEYLNNVALDLNIPQENVFSMAEMLGEEEDFDGLISTLENY